jgi:outer membrane protein assembly factor BamE (lipoprotein component of BamABCDE complex)
MRIVTLMSLLLLAALAGCGSPQYAANWGDLRSGMTSAEVERILGEPSSRSSISRHDGGIIRQRWEYGESSGPSVRGVRLESPGDVFIVDFDGDGRVTGFRRPETGRHADRTNR